MPRTFNVRECLRQLISCTRKAKIVEGKASFLLIYLWKIQGPHNGYLSEGATAY